MGERKRKSEMEVFDNAATVLKELVDTGQTNRRLVEQLEREKSELSAEYDKMKNDFFYNLDIIKDLEEACRKAEASREAESRKVKLLQVQVSDEVIKLKRLHDQFD